MVSTFKYTRNEWQIVFEHLLVEPTHGECKRLMALLKIEGDMSSEKVLEGVLTKSHAGYLVAARHALQCAA